MACDNMEASMEPVCRGVPSLLKYQGAISIGIPLALEDTPELKLDPTVFFSCFNCHAF